ncbi:BrnT family toxin [Dyadobacter sp. CY327]|uniref:BrnT family toxin n=1 Tax=Dyadobacter sp. CY327 TaxID=2907301 RepID=UPI0038D48382
MIEFEWDDHNRKHILEDYPKRENTKSEVESIFNDPFMEYRMSERTTTEQRYIAIGLSNLARIRVVIFTIREERIRPISSWPASTQTKRHYYERAKN